MQFIISIIPLFFNKAYARDLLSDDLWSDFKDGNSATSYQNTDGNTIESMNMGAEIWVASESYAAPCAILSSSLSDQHKLKSVACTHQAKYACVKQCMCFKIKIYFIRYRMLIFS